MKQSLQAQNITDAIMRDCGAGLNPAGAICAANEERFTTAHFSEPLTGYTVGWLSQAEAAKAVALLESIAPTVQVGRRFEFKAAANAEEFLSETDDVRAIGADFKTVKYGGSSVNEKTLNKGLTISLDKDEMVAGDEERAAARLTARLIRNDLRRAVAALSGSANNTAKTWDATAGKDPDADVLGELVTANIARGVPSDVVVYGETAWQKRALSLRAQTHSGGFASAMMNAAALAQLLGVDRVEVSKQVYQSAVATKTGIVANKVIIFSAPQGLSKDDPSNIKRFVTPTGSGIVRVYRQDFAKRVEISVEHYSNVVITSTVGIRQLTIS